MPKGTEIRSREKAKPIAKIPSTSTLEDVRKLFRKIDHAQADLRFLLTELEKAKAAVASALKSNDDFARAVEGSSAPTEQIELAAQLQRSIALVRRELERFERQAPRRKRALESLHSLTKQNLLQLRMFHRLTKSSKLL